MASKNTKKQVASKPAIKKSKKFNPKIAIIVIAVLAIALGYLFVRLSRAATTDSNGSAISTGCKDCTRSAAPYMLTDTSASDTIATRPTSGKAIQITITDTRSTKNSKRVINVTYAVREDVSSWTITKFKIDGVTASFEDSQAISIKGYVTKSYGLDQEGTYTFEANGELNGKIESAKENFDYKKSSFDISDSTVGGMVGGSTSGSQTQQATNNAANPPAAGNSLSGAPAAPAPATNSIDCSVQTNKRGSTGFCVKIIQESLKNLGYDPGSIDSNYGEKTEAAVKVFQQKNAISVDGIVGPVTYKKLGDPNAARKQ